MGKTSLVHLIVKGSAVSRPPQTIGCAVDVKVTLVVPLVLKSDSEKLCI